MADTKISALTQAAPLETGDQFIVERGGVNNFRATIAQISALVGGVTNPLSANLQLGAFNITGVSDSGGGRVEVATLQLSITTAVSSILDEDNMASDLDTALATQQSIKAYVDANSGLLALINDPNPQLANHLRMGGFNLTDNTLRTLLELDEAAAGTVDHVAISQTLSSALTGPSLNPEGAGTDIPIRIAGKGTGEVDIGSKATFADVLNAIDGSFLAPTYGFNTSPDTGMYLTTGKIGFGVGGSQIVTVGSTEMFLAGRLDVFNPFADSEVFVSRGSVIGKLVQKLTETELSSNKVGNSLALYGDNHILNLTLSGAAGSELSAFVKDVTAGGEMTASGFPLSELIGSTLATGVIAGGEITINADPTKFDISDGTGTIFDAFTDPNNPTITPVSWSGITAITPLFGASGSEFQAIDSAGDLVQQSDGFTMEQRHTLIVLGSTGIVGSTIAAVANDVTQRGESYLESDIADLIGTGNPEGNSYTAAATDLTITKLAGEAFEANISFFTQPTNPHRKLTPFEAEVSFLTAYSDGAGGTTTVSGQTDIDPGNYDDLSGVLQSVGSNQWTIQVIYYFPDSGTTVVQYGQELFTSFANAEAALPTLSFTSISDSLVSDTIRSFLIVKGNETNLTSSNALFVQTGKFGAGTAGGSAPGGGFQDMQETYNNSIEPEVLTDPTRGAITIRRGSGADTDAIWEGQNGAGTVTYRVAGDGNVTAHDGSFKGPNFSIGEPDSVRGILNIYGAAITAGSRINMYFSEDESASGAQDYAQLNAELQRLRIKGTNGTVDIFTIGVATGDGMFSGNLRVANGIVQQYSTESAVGYTLILTDAGLTIERDNGSANTLTVPPNSSVAFPIGTEILVKQRGAGQSAFVEGVGVTINSFNDDLKLEGQGASAVLTKSGTDVWDLDGRLTA